MTSKSYQCALNLEKPGGESSMCHLISISLLAKICCGVCLIVWLPFLVLTDDVIGRVPYLKLTLRAYGPTGVSYDDVTSLWRVKE